MADFEEKNDNFEKLDALNDDSLNLDDKPENEPEKKKEKKPKKKVKKNVVLTAIIIILVIALIIALLLMKGCNSNNATAVDNTPVQVEKTQGTYVAPEEPVDRSQQVTLPGWGGFTIPAGTAPITQGFEFHNPEENMWYEDNWYDGDKFLEKLVVDSGDKIALNHYLSLVGIDSKATDVQCDESVFSISDEPVLDDDGNETGETQKSIQAIAPYEGDKDVTVTCEDGTTKTFTVNGMQNYYYMSFGLYLDNSANGGEDELLYQSGLVEPGMYIQQMEMSRALDAGTYDAYVVVQPYQSDKTTPTNSGTVKITLTVA